MGPRPRPRSQARLSGQLLGDERRGARPAAVGHGRRRSARMAASALPKVHPVPWSFGRLDGRRRVVDEDAQSVRPRWPESPTNTTPSFGEVDGRVATGEERASSRLGATTGTARSSRDTNDAEYAPLRTSTGSTTSGEVRPAGRPRARDHGRRAEHPGLDDRTGRSSRTASIWASTTSSGTGWTACTPVVSCAVTAVTTHAPWTAEAPRTRRGRPRPRPPRPESVPATVSTTGGVTRSASRSSATTRGRVGSPHHGAHDRDTVRAGRDRSGGVVRRRSRRARTPEWGGRRRSPAGRARSVAGLARARGVRRQGGPRAPSPLREHTSSGEWQDRPHTLGENALLRRPGGGRRTAGPSCARAMTVSPGVR